MRKLHYLFLCVALLAISGGVMAEDQVMFEYQGRVKVSGQPFNGTGRFKFAIMNTSATASLWSNDGTSDNGSEPSAYLEAQVTDGVFTIMIGDTSLGMQSINSSIFQSRTPLRLRTWFSDVTHPFEQLNPDSKLVNISLITIGTGETDYTIYVNGTTGNDANSGLTPAKAKKTIQAGVNAVPRQLMCNVTVKVAPGVYRETVDVSGVSGSGVLDNGTFINGNGLRIIGDEIWQPSSGGSPNVLITGCDNDTTSAPVRAYGIVLHNNTTVELQGLHMSYCNLMGVRTENGVYLIKNCAATHNSFQGFAASVSSFLAVHRSIANNNSYHGFSCGWCASMWLYDCVAEYNTGGSGVNAGYQACVQCSGTTSRYNSIGCSAGTHASISLTNTTVSNNTTGLTAYRQAFIQRGTGVTVTGNTTATASDFDGAIY